MIWGYTQIDQDGWIDPVQGRLIVVDDFSMLTTAGLAAA